MIRPSPGAGFTLVELLVATTLLALLSVILFGGMRFGARAWEAGTASMERVGEVEAAQELLRRTLVEAAVPASIGPAEEPAFAGTEGQVHFVAPLPAHAGTGGLGRYALRADDRGELTIGWEPRRPERKLDSELGAKPSTILQRVSALKLSYYGAVVPGEQAAWHDSWKGRELPSLIRIDVSFAEGDRRSWPDLVVAPRLAGSTEQGG